MYIAIFIAPSTVFAAVDYKSGQPNGWFGSQWQEISAYVLYRTGTLGFMLLSIPFLFAARNNVLLWLTNWSHSTYLLLHRWVARVFALYVVIHSIIGLQIYAAHSKEVWWIWGAVATVATVLLAIGSELYVRASQYEFFLISHVLLSVFVVVGCWYHIIGWYASMAIYIPVTWGYEIWVYFGIAVWFFDRLARVGRILKNGAPRSRVPDLGNGYVRVDIHGIRWGAATGTPCLRLLPDPGSPSPLGEPPVLHHPDAEPSAARQLHTRRRREARGHRARQDGFRRPAQHRHPALHQESNRHHEAFAVPRRPAHPPGRAVFQLQHGACSTL